MSDLDVKIVEHIATLGTHSGGWNKELNLVSWNGMTPKYEIRDWDPGHTRCGKGSPMTTEEFNNLCKVCAEFVKE